MPTSYPRRVRRSGLVRALHELYEVAVGSSRVDVELDLPVAPVSRGTTSEATAQPLQKACHHAVEYTARGDAPGSLGPRGPPRSRHSKSTCTLRVSLGREGACWTRGPSISWCGSEKEASTGVSRSTFVGQRRSTSVLDMRGHICWTGFLDKAVGRLVASGQTGNRRASRFVMSRSSEVVERGLLNGKAMLIVALFMLREAEVSAATTGHLHFDMDEKVMTLTLCVGVRLRRGEEGTS